MQCLLCSKYSRVTERQQRPGATLQWFVALLVYDIDAENIQYGNEITKECSNLYVDVNIARQPCRGWWLGEVGDGWNIAATTALHH